MEVGWGLSKGRSTNSAQQTTEGWGEAGKRNGHQSRAGQGNRYTGRAYTAAVQVSP